MKQRRLINIRNYKAITLRDIEVLFQCINSFIT